MFRQITCPVSMCAMTYTRCASLTARGDAVRGDKQKLYAMNERIRPRDARITAGRIS